MRFFQSNIIAPAAAAMMVVAASLPISSPAYAQSAQSSGQYKQRADQLFFLFNKQIAYNDYFSANFLQAVPTAQLDQIITSVAAQYGRPVQVRMIIANGPNSGVVKFEFERAIATIEMVVDPRSPYKVSGLLLQGFEVANDDFEAINSEISALPGRAGYAIHRLNDGAAPIVQHQLNGKRHFAIGSTFKLYILAELAAKIENGQRRWSDVAPLSPKSSTIGGTQKWPEGSPLSLQSLATLMISVSDNNATDALIALLGREQIEARIARIGHSDIRRMTPFLSTAEAFAFKMRLNDRLRRDFLKADEKEQQRIVARNTQSLSIQNYNAAEFGNGPLYINDIEWFANADDIARLMDILRQSQDPVVRTILSINSGVGIGDAGRWNYLGYKGGSEPGVISLSFLVQSKQGQWYSVSGSWNNPAREVDQNRFIGIMTRILNIASRL